MLKILHKRPWFITNNNSYRFTDTNVWESTQKDFTFYVEFQMDEINTGDTHCIFCRPGKHMGVFAKNRNMFTWDFWDVIDGKSNFNDISFYVGRENLYKRYVMIISHDSISKRFKAKLTCLDDDNEIENTIEEALEETDAVEMETEADESKMEEVD